ncbi:MAG: 23S rRNA (pseudouridine(1915)-N(3))-methyltransferase RlmH [Bacteroidales bacterium]|nr:23S rRNA (pseudouridine(1915)-N(3))-methyltransferase RlmH [Bacteroidales bacterium]MCM1416240.1 23S rRNA (pseudouridine(1915)-N(3))-methyltransferase RlmH [bacterium]MCM1424863.1 23S rRNA (pseudouridine(1915)-N(3))-methyltransferase RlmH [bacterium]
MKITLITVGKIKEAFYREAVSEYRKRLSRYAALEIREAEDERTPEGISDSEKERILGKEGERIEKLLPENAYLVTLEIEGKQYTSEAFAQRIADLGVRGVSHIAFVIGGSLGLHNSIKERADLKVSFSEMTFPHQLMRVILLEQIYRAFRILNGEPYHK